MAKAPTGSGVRFTPDATMNGPYTACTPCATLDTDTAAIRAKRTAARNAQ